jgi:hypothetical protein
MGITCALYRATEDEIDRLIEDPATVGSFLDPVGAFALPVKTVRLKGLAGLILPPVPDHDHRGGLGANRARTRPAT